MLVRTRTRALLPAVLVVAVLVGCGGASRSGPAATAPTAPVGTAPARGAEPGAGAAYAPRDALLYLTADRSTDAWKRLAPLRARVSSSFDGSPPDPLQVLAFMLTGRLLDVPPGGPAEAYAGEGAVIVVPGEDAPGASVDAASPRLLVYDAVTDHAALERWFTRTAERTGDDGEFALYTSKLQGGFVSALSDGVVLTGTRVEDLHAAIERAAAGHESLNDDAAFRAALARQHDEGAGIVGYSRGEIVDTMTLGMFAQHAKQTQLTSALGLADVSFGVGAGASGLWVHFHPPPAPAAGRPGPAFAPTLLDRVPKGAYAYLGLSDAGKQLPYLAGIWDGLMAYIGSAQTSAGLPAWTDQRLGMTSERAAAFLSGEQAWWWGLQSGIAFRPADPAAALAAAQPLSNPDLHLDYGIDQLAATRDGDVVTVKGVARPGASSTPIADDAAFTGLLKAAGVPEQVSLLLYVDRRLIHGFDPPKGEDGKPRSDVLSGMVLWIAPTGVDTFDVAIYFDLENRS